MPLLVLCMEWVLPKTYPNLRCGTTISLLLPSHLFVLLHLCSIQRQKFAPYPWYETWDTERNIGTCRYRLNILTAVS